jgi:hypothetical protein
MRVFVCSTCYDLLDLRAELEAFFRGAGVTPVLSDRLNSEFEVRANSNSIETCLVNVRNCDEFVIVLSSRYGPSLAPAGFPDYSAMHLEYLEARKHHKPIHMYVRDRLEADFVVWRNNSKRPDLSFAWCKDGKDHRIFEILDEHRKLVEGSAQSNWLWVFKDSVELKARLAVDFKKDLARATVTRLFENGRVPFLEVTGTLTEAPSTGRTIKFELVIRNAGTAVALSPLLEFEGDSLKYPFPSLAGQREHRLHLSYGKPGGLTLKLRSRLSYSILEGHKFTDVAELAVPPNYAEPGAGRVTYERRERLYIGASPDCQLK